MHGTPLREMNCEASKSTDNVYFDAKLHCSVCHTAIMSSDVSTLGYHGNLCLFFLKTGDNHILALFFLNLIYLLTDVSKDVKNEFLYFNLK